MLPTQPNKYLEASIQTATPAQLLIMTYDGAIRFCKQAIESIKNNEFDKSHYYLSKTQDIVKEFIITMDRSVPLSEDLLRLYDYFLTKLIEANVKKATAPVEEVLSYLIDLKETWIQAAKLSGATKVGSKQYG
ncbi:flagellar export chaperone FliS [Paenibacillus eucommiae]|uniref:Flagellar secretion chaperone FliS n=1 Tax=Paenibacillus eucommiae TaxID=1355755 RepID=A0ABS4J0K8_9BACL|nr:flagellar export chaperone FliS [Paenibacillus eucommiae]MBP1992651.1 flagellar protein FliS [Paenibacillus eucommiae]